MAIIGGTLLLVVEEPLSNVAAAEGQIVFGALLEVVLAMSVVGMAVMLFPILKKQSEGMALGYVGMRILEGVLILTATTSAVVVSTLSRDEQSGSTEQLIDLLLASREWTYFLGTIFMFSVTTLILYTVLYQSRLVPIWLSVWGLVGGALLVVRALLEMFGQEFSAAVQLVLAAPIGLNEMVLAVWLIAKGFNVAALDSRPEKQPVSG